ncbi:NAD-glutamate dehydrogenase [Agaribacterium haliotis]|uniref:NAD-glutamate dehydrogenase n=1 Tax=Agaribacterium haliotis TaxID=2013869 RepID=UPI000BB589F7|nr:NAD-glutamate dehydrogenase [Agaribacterium haliotis]
MELAHKHLDDKRLLLSELGQLSPGENRKQALELSWAALMLENFPLADWLGRPLNDLRHALLNIYHFVSDRQPGLPSCQVYNPNLQDDGWVCARTVVLFNSDDYPFLVDSLRMVFEQCELGIHIASSRIVTLQRNKRGDLLLDADSDASERAETLAYFEISAIADAADLKQLEQRLLASAADVAAVVGDYPAMVDKLNQCIEELEAHGLEHESIAFLRWLKNSHFTFLGYRDLSFEGDPDTPGQVEGRVLVEDAAARLGIFKVIDCDSVCTPAMQFVLGASDFYKGDEVLCFSKSRTRATVHRHVYPDYVVVKKYDAEGRVCGERRFLGFYTYAVSSLSPKQIPILRQRVDYVLKRSGLNPKSHDGKRLQRCIELHPKDELFQAKPEELYQSLKKITELNERDIIRLLIRADAFGQFVSCLVYVPRELYTTRLRLQIQNLIGERLGSADIDSTTFFSESKHARAHIVFRLKDKHYQDFSVDELEQQIIELCHGWQEHFRRALDERFGEAKALKLYKDWGDAFSQSYQDSYDARVAVEDIISFETLTAPGEIAMSLAQSQGFDNKNLKFRVAHLRDMLELSDVIPILETMGLRVLGEEPFLINKGAELCYWIHDFTLVPALDIELDVKAIKQKFEQCFKFAWQKQIDSDGFNRLVVAAELDWRQVNLLRAYANYMKQTLFKLSLDYIADTLVAYPKLTRELIHLFELIFNPAQAQAASAGEGLSKQALSLIESIELGLDEVSVLSQEQVFRRYLEFTQATLRTNFYQRDNRGAHAPYIALKFEPQTISDLPEPRPAYEFFVYSARVEGVHLRSSKVARGGLRWSDRNEDYRTEVLGLVKAQQVKNAVIVPSGAKGGFVAKQLAQTKDRAAFMKEGIACYQLFIRALLDLTDSLIDTEIHRPEQVVCRDGDDAYLVVAADKGTASFSDIANEISAEKKHWLGDAFASGGSQGYDHKAMGITARGAWVSVQRLFREKGLHTQRDEFSVIGIGDMGGDVFGNGMLLSNKIRLLAAFNHLHIFIDPAPDAEQSFAERQRLFAASASGWDAYNKTLISQGGGVWRRSEKFIELSPEIRNLIACNATRLTPTQLIHALLKAQVQLIWNGGIGTYVKSEAETHADVGDKTNDAVRVNGSELRCEVFGEGGNLGLTQLGRIEFAANGGACNTDFIDNAAGVDCSDHEVNIKILIDAQVANGDLTVKQRNALLEAMTDDVSRLVLNNNYKQTLALSIAEQYAVIRGNEYRRFIKHLEEQGRLNRSLEYLPSDEQLAERSAAEQGLYRPELAVLISYAKVQLKEALVESDIADDAYCARSLFNLFPERLHDDYAEQIKHHKLRAQIIATQLANDLINRLGITAFYRLAEISGSSAEEVVRAYVIAREVFCMEDFFAYVASLDYSVEASLQHELLATLMRRVRRASSWFLKNRRGGLDVEKEVSAFKAKLKQAQNCVASLLPQSYAELWQKRSDELKAQGLADEWIDSMVMPDNLFSGLGVVEVSNCSGAAIERCVESFTVLMHELKLDWFANQLAQMKVDNFWQASAREAYIDDLEAQLRKLSTCLLSERYEGSVGERLGAWLESNQAMISRWRSMVSKVEASSRVDSAMFSVALRELNDLVQVTVHR